MLHERVAVSDHQRFGRGSRASAPEENYPSGSQTLEYSHKEGRGEEWVCDMRFRSGGLAWLKILYLLEVRNSWVHCARNTETLQGREVVIDNQGRYLFLGFYISRDVRPVWCRLLLRPVFIYQGEFKALLRLNKKAEIDWTQEFYQRLPD